MGKLSKFPNIVKLGSGPGWNIFELLQMLGTKGRNHNFFALEYIDATRKVYKSIADDQPTLFFPTIRLNR